MDQKYKNRLGYNPLHQLSAAQMLIFKLSRNITKILKKIWNNNELPKNKAAMLLLNHLLQ